jgi:hypothetical protein
MNGENKENCNNRKRKQTEKWIEKGKAKRRDRKSKREKVRESVCV